MNSLKMHSVYKFQPRYIVGYLFTFVCMATTSLMLINNWTFLLQNLKGLRCDAFTCFSLEEETIERPEGPAGNRTFLINTPGKCQWSYRNRLLPKLAVLVHSKVDNFNQRKVIRKTWASNHGNYRAIIMFLVGTTENISIQEQLLIETKIYGDIIQVNVTDHYKLLTYKSMAMVQWFYQHCSDADFYLKVDDDVYLFLPNWIRALRNVTQDTFFLCSIKNETKPVRDVDSKWYVSHEQYSGKYYPLYCNGPSYLFSSKVLTILYKTVFNAKLFVMEDTFLTGMAVAGQNITYVYGEGIVLWNPYWLWCPTIRWLAVHSLTPSQLLTVHSFYSRNRKRCYPGSSVSL